MEGLSRDNKTGMDSIKRLFQRGSGRLVTGSAAETGWRNIAIPLVLLAAALLFWSNSLQYVQLENLTDLGLVSVLPLGFWFGVIALMISFAILVFNQAHRTGLLFLHTALLVVIIHGTPAILYGTLRYSWAWKHVGIVDYIMRHGSVNPTISYLDAYHNWPGFFAFNAFLTQAAGLSTAVDYARWAPLVFNLLFLGALFLVYHAITWDKRLVWMSIWIFFLTNWVGQDYFSPQAFTYFLYLALIGILLRWFQPLTTEFRGDFQRSGWIARLSGSYQRFITHASSDVFVLPSTPGQRVALVLVAILVMFVIVASHQLTPIMAIIALFALILFRRLYPSGLALLLAVLTMSWIWFVASPFIADNLRSLIVSVGTLQSNLASNFINLNQASQGQVTVAIIGRLLTLSVAVLGLIGFIIRRRHGHLDLAALALALTPLPVMAINSYGGEVLFRVYLFALPFFSFFIAAIFFPDVESRPRVFTPIFATVLSLVLLIAFSFAYYGKERQYYFSREEVAASDFLFRIAPPGSMIIEGTRNYPSVYKNYEQYKFVTIAREPAPSQLTILSDPLGTMERWMSDPRYPNTYLILTRSQKAEVDAVGSMPAGSLDRIEEAVRQSGGFEMIFSNKDASIYVYHGEE